MPPMLRSRKEVFVAVKLTSRRRLQIRKAGPVAFLALAGVLCWNHGLINSAHLSPNTYQDRVETSAIKVHEGRETITRYVGDEQLQSTLTHNAALARSLTSGDFNEDGMPDLVAAYESASKGILVLHRGNPEAIFPNNLTANRITSTDSAAPFLLPAKVFRAEESPSIISSGDFDADGHLDVITTARGSRSLRVMAGDGHGSFTQTYSMNLPGTVTSFTTGEVNRRDGLADIVVGITSADGPKVLIYSSPQGALKAEPEAIHLPAESRAVALGRLSGLAFEDLAVSAGNQLLMVEGRDLNRDSVAGRTATKTPPVIQQLHCSSEVIAMVAGDFPAGALQRLAVLAADGTLRLVGKESQAWKISAVSSGLSTNANALFTARVSARGGDDLVILNEESGELQILSNELKRQTITGTGKSRGLPVPSVDLDKTLISDLISNNAATRITAESIRESETTTELAAAELNLLTPILDKSAVAILPMRLTRAATSSLVFLKQGQSTPEVMRPSEFPSPQSTFTVINANDNGTGSLRQAILDANEAKGADIITFAIPSDCKGPPCPTRTINLLSPLPTVTGPVLIDGYSQPFTSPNTLVSGNNAVLLIELNGASAGAGDGLAITAGSSTIRGLVINGFNGSAISLSANGGNIIEGNFLGTNAAGTVRVSNAFNGIYLFDVGNNLIGGTTPQARNIISGNGSNSIPTFSYPNVFIGGVNAANNSVLGNYIGTDKNGTVAITAAVAGGVHISGAPNNFVGSQTAGARNLISGNDANGILIGGASSPIDATANLVQNNFIGTNVTGTQALGNRFTAVGVQGPSNTVGGSTSSARNVISGTTDSSGLAIIGGVATLNLVQGNFIGTDVNGTAALSNSRHGVIVIGSSLNTVGGLTSGTRNILSGNQLNGISIETDATFPIAEQNIVQGNYIGTTSTGDARLANGNNGVRISAGNNNTIGPANLISGNSLSGIRLTGAAATANLLQGNLVGTNAAGTGAIGNNLHGVELIDSQGNTIGGPTVGTGNTIAFNAQDGIEIVNGNGNLIRSNSIFSNSMLGIDLSPNGVTPNDQGDSDNGANNLQNFPILTSVVNFGSNTIVQGTLNSTPNTTFNIQVFSNAGCDSSGNGEGQTIRGSASVTTSASGNANINLTIPSVITAQFTATATDPNNNTSEFSACKLSTTESFLQFSSANFSATEAAGSTAITVSRSGGNGGVASVQFSIAGGGSATGGTSCTQGVDYVTTSGTLQWADGETGNKTFPITICDDVIFEGNETVNIALANSVGATLGAQNTAVFTLNDNDSQPTISITDVTQSEGNSGTTTFAFAVSLSNPSSQTVTANYATADGTANAVGDYQPISPATLTFSPGITSRPINVLVIADTLNESNETFFVNLANATNAVIADNQGVGTITDDDPVPTGTLQISGRVVDDSARSIAGAIVFLGGAASGSKVTDSSGNYSFTNLNPGNYTVAPAVGVYSYSPASYIFDNLVRNRVANFVGTQMIVSIIGRVTDSNNVGLGGVALGLIRNGVPAGTTATDVLGNYGFGNLSAGSNYVVTPLGSFTPGRLFFNALTTNTIGNFRSLPIVSPGSAVITGRVLDPNSNPITNATLTLSGPITGVTSTDADGNYAFLNLTAGGNYAVTIQNSQYVFAPSRADFFNLASAQTFNLTALPVGVPEPTPDPNDDFTSDTRDPNKWSLGIQTQPPENFDPQVTVTQGSGRLVIRPLTQAPGMHYNGYVSANAFDMTNGSVSVELTSAADGGADSVFAIGTDRNNFYRFMVRTAGPSAGPAMMIKGIDGVERPLDTAVSQLLFQIVVAGQLTTLPIPYVESQHRHLRFRHESAIVSPPFGAIVFEASPDPEQFDYTVLHRTNLMSRVVPNMTTELSAGTSTATNPGQTVFRNYMLVTSTVQFSNAAYTVDESGGSVQISVTRTGNIAGADAVDYATADGTASQTTRYINTAGRLMFGPGEASQTFRVLIIDNALTEGNQNLNLLLRNPLNAGLNTPGRAVLTINDNDTTEPTTNPLDDPTRYVQQHYYDFLSREPDAPGLAFWVDQITQCGTVTQCVEIRRINVSAAYFLSPEFQNTGFLAYRFYNLALNRPNGLPRYLEFLRDTQALARGVIGGTPGSEALLEANRIAYANEFVTREEFTGLYPLSQAPAEYVDALYAHAGITPSSAERQAAIDEFNTPAGARGRVLRHVAENATLSNRERNRAFVLAQYFGYLRRNPDDAPDNNLDGYNFWLGKLNEFDGNFVNAEMVKAFITSGEYRRRFGP